MVSTNVAQVCFLEIVIKTFAILQLCNTQSGLYIALWIIHHLPLHWCNNVWILNTRSSEGSLRHFSGSSGYEDPNGAFLCHQKECMPQRFVSCASSRFISLLLSPLTRLFDHSIISDEKCSQSLSSKSMERFARNVYPNNNVLVRCINLLMNYK